MIEETGMEIKSLNDIKSKLKGSIQLLGLGEFPQLREAIESLELSWDTVTQIEELHDPGLVRELSILICGIRSFVEINDAQLQLFLRERSDMFILLVAAPEDEGLISECLQRGVFDILDASASKRILQLRLRNTIEHHFLMVKNRRLEDLPESKLQNQLEWVKFKEVRRIISEEKHTLYNLQTSLSQGGGMVNTISLIDMLRATMQDEPGGFLMDKDLVNLIFENNAISRTMMNSMRSLVELMDCELNLEPFELKDLRALLPEIVAPLLPGMEERGLKVVWPELTINCEVQVDTKYLREVILELFINACQYSLRESEIILNAHYDRDFLYVSLRNEVMDGLTGVPAQHQKMVTEPFYRMQQEVHEDFGDVEVYGIGLGLAMVEYVVRKHNGLYFIQNIEPKIESANINVISGFFLPARQLKEEVNE